MTKTDPFQTRGSLLKRLKERDESGWLLFYRQYQPLIQWLAIRRGIHEPSSVDLVIQSVMLHFAKLNWEHDPERGRFRSLILSVTEYKIREIRRETQGRPNIIPLDEVDLTEEAPIEDEREHQLAHAIAMLSEDHSVLPVHLCVLTQSLEGRSHDEIAVNLGLTLSNCMVIRHRMVKKLRSLLAPKP
jgi:DNA-directed RNA polymerase specialized sigma24 family protein